MAYPTEELSRVLTQLEALRQSLDDHRLAVELLVNRRATQTRLLATVMVLVLALFSVTGTGMLWWQTEKVDREVTFLCAQMERRDLATAIVLRDSVEEPRPGEDSDRFEARRGTIDALVNVFESEPCPGGEDDDGD